MLITQKELDEVLAANPHLEGNGLAPFKVGDTPSRVDLAQVDLAIRWLGHHGRRATINPHYSSYGLKHHAENTGPVLRRNAVPYISNGAFIAAALHLNYRVSRIGRTPNARINISFNKKTQAELLKKAGAVRSAQCHT
jgi:hypothetical protein